MNFVHRIRQTTVVSFSPKDNPFDRFTITFTFTVTPTGYGADDASVLSIFTPVIWCPYPAINQHQISKEFLWNVFKFTYKHTTLHLVLSES